MVWWRRRGWTSRRGRAPLRSTTGISCRSTSTRPTSCAAPPRPAPLRTAAERSLPAAKVKAGEELLALADELKLPIIANDFQRCAPAALQAPPARSDDDKHDKGFNLGAEKRQ